VATAVAVGLAASVARSSPNPARAADLQAVCEDWIETAYPKDGAWADYLRRCLRGEAGPGVAVRAKERAAAAKQASERKKAENDQRRKRSIKEASFVVRIGMTERELLDAMSLAGVSGSLTKTTDRGGVHQTWTMSAGRYRFIHLDDGVVTSFQE
jgi:hypothetical protein